MEEAANYVWNHVEFQTKPWKKTDKVHSTKRAKLYNKKWLEAREEQLSFKESEKFRPSNDPYENTRAWNSFEKCLKREFSNACRYFAKRRISKTWRDLYKEEADKRYKEDIFPPRPDYDIVRSNEKGTTADVVFEHPYSALKQSIDLWAWNKHITPEKNYPRIMGINSQLNLAGPYGAKGKGNPARRALDLRHALGLHVVPLHIWNIYLIPERKTFDYWHNPFGVGRLADEILCDYNSIIPHYIPKKKKELLEMRDSYYGRKLNPDEWMMLGSVKRSDQIIFYLLRHMWSGIDEPPGKESYFGEITSLLQQYPGSGEFIDHLRSSDADDIADYMTMWSLASDLYQQKKVAEGRERLAARLIERAEQSMAARQHFLETKGFDFHILEEANAEENRKAFLERENDFEDDPWKEKEELPWELSLDAALDQLGTKSNQPAYMLEEEGIPDDPWGDRQETILHEEEIAEEVTSEPYEYEEDEEEFDPYKEEVVYLEDLEPQYDIRDPNFRFFDDNDVEEAENDPFENNFEEIETEVIYEDVEDPKNPWDD